MPAAKLPARRCCAHLNKDGKSGKKGDPCPNGAIQGGTVCVAHGGRVRHTREAAARNVARFRADHFLARHSESLAPVEDPVSELARIGGEVIAAKDYFASQIEELRYSNNNTGEQLRAEVALWERAIDRCVKVLAELTRLNISERRTRIAEAQAVMLLAVVDRILTRLDLTPAQKAISVEVVAEEFEAMGQE